MRALLAGASVVLFAATAAAQGHHHHPFRPAAGEFPLIPGMGDLHHEVGPTNEMARKYFDQGLTLVYGFNYDGAYASFREALRHDPELAMAHWGMALALGANINVDVDADRMRRAAEHLVAAGGLAHATPRDRAYVEALSRRYSLTPEKADWKQLAIDYSVAMKGLYEKYWVDELAKAKPDPDPDAAVLYAESLMDLHPWDLWEKDGKTPTSSDTPRILSLLDAVRGYEPTRRHVGAVHYRLHAYEPSVYWARAVDEAEILRTLVPASGHLVHMPSHVALLQGDFLRAAESNWQAIGIDRDYQRQIADDGYVGHYLSHNLHFYAVALALAGREGEAVQAAGEARAFVAGKVAGEAGLEHYLATPILVLARFGKWDQLAVAEEPDARWKAAHALWQWGRAVAALGLRHDSAVERYRGFFLAETENVPSDLSWGNAKAREVLRIAALDLDARIAAAHGDAAEDARLRGLAAAAEKDLHYDEPPPWVIISKGRYP